MLFVLSAIDKPNSLALRTATRQAHFDYAMGNDVVKLGGPFLDANGEMAGSLIIFEVADLEAAQAMARKRSLCESGICSGEFLDMSLRGKPPPTAAAPISETGIRT